MLVLSLFSWQIMLEICLFLCFMLVFACFLAVFLCSARLIMPKEMLAEWIRA